MPHFDSRSSHPDTRSRLAQAVAAIPLSIPVPPPTTLPAPANIAGRIDLPNAFIVKYDGRVVGLTPEQDSPYDAELWDELDGGLTVAVVDRCGSDACVIAVPDGVRQLDVFHHPYASTA